MGDHSYAYIIEANRLLQNIESAITSAIFDISDHHTRHENGGADVISLAGLAVAAADLTGNIAAARMTTNIVAAIASLDPTLTSLTFDSIAAIKRDVTNSGLEIFGGTSVDTGVLFVLYGLTAPWVEKGGVDFYLAYDSAVPNTPFFTIKKRDVQTSSSATVFRIDKDGNIIISGVYNDTVAGTANVIVSAGGHLQRAISNEKNKKNIKDLTLDTSKIYDLKPREFQWDHEIEELRETEIDEETKIKKGKVIRPKQIITKEHVGLIAEEVEKITPEFATHNIETGVSDGIEWNTIIVSLLAEVKKLKIEVDELKLKR